MTKLSFKTSRECLDYPYCKNQIYKITVESLNMTFFGVGYGSNYIGITREQAFALMSKEERREALWCFDD